MSEKCSYFSNCGFILELKKHIANIDKCPKKPGCKRPTEFQPVGLEINVDTPGFQTTEELQLATKLGLFNTYKNL